jgi:hypothetical protein
MPSGWIRGDPAGHTGKGKPFDDYEQGGYQGVQQIEFHCSDAGCDGGGIKGLKITYANNAIAQHGAVGETPKKPKPAHTQVFVVAADADEYINQISVFWANDHNHMGIGVQLTTSTGRSAQFGHRSGRQSTTATAPPGHQLASFIGTATADSVGSIGWYFAPNCNSITRKQGFWTPLTYSSGQQQYSFTVGTRSSYTKSTTQTWSRSTTESVTAGFSFEGFSTSTTVSHTASYEIAKSYSSTFEMDKEQTSTLSFPPGQIWQWHFNVTDVCGSTDVLGRDWVQTANAVDEPCCPPGFALNATVQHGACVDEVLSVCGSK